MQYPFLMFLDIFSLQKFEICMLFRGGFILKFTKKCFLLAIPDASAAFLKYTLIYKNFLFFEF